MNTPTDKVRVSVLVPIKNEADNLPPCLGSVQWTNEVLPAEAAAEIANAIADAGEIVGYWITRSFYLA